MEGETFERGQQRMMEKRREDKEKREREEIVKKRVLIEQIDYSGTSL